MAQGPHTAEVERDFDRVDFVWLTNWLNRRAERRQPRKGIVPPSDGWIGPAMGLAVAIGLALWLTAGGWGGRPPFGEDTMPHLIRAQFALGHLLPHFRIDGW